MVFVVWFAATKINALFEGGSGYEGNKGESGKESSDLHIVVEKVEWFAILV